VKKKGKLTIFVIAAAALTACASPPAPEDPPIITITEAAYEPPLELPIQKVAVIITAEEKQEFTYDGSPKAVVFSVDQNVEPGVTYYHVASVTPTMRGFPLTEPPTERGVYKADIVWAEDAYYLGASKEVYLVIR
jgi:hypothetical protein